MSLFHRRPKNDVFIQGPVHQDIFTDFVSHLEELIYFPQFSVESLEKKGIVGPCKTLNDVAATAIKNIMYQLYHVPAVRHYFGDDLVHGFAARVTGDAITFENLDDTIVCVQLTKEITKTISHLFYPFLEKYNCYVLYEGDSFSFITAEQMQKMKKLHIEGRLVWVD